MCADLKQVGKPAKMARQRGQVPVPIIPKGFARLRVPDRGLASLKSRLIRRDIAAKTAAWLSCIFITPP
jgi:hypothetical protein